MYQYKNVHYIHFDVVDSTNSWVKEHADSLDKTQVTCITALEQTAGRGRRSNQWVSPRGQNIYASFFFCLPKDSQIVANVPQVLSLSCAAILKKYGFSPQIKWPNDILLEGKKVAGILTETKQLDNYLGVIIGIGINVNMKKELLDRIDQPAISLAQLSGHTWPIEQILNLLLQRFLKDLSKLQKKGFEPFYKSYEKLMAFKGKKITCQIGKNKITGICEGILPDGRLKLLTPEKMEYLTSAEIQG